MALQQIRIGNAEDIYQYDDAAAAFTSGIDCTAPISAAAPVNVRDVLRLEDISAAGPLVEGPGASTDHAIVRWDGAGGYTLQNSVVIVDDAGLITIPGGSFIGAGANHSDFSATGILTMAGTARVYGHVRVTAPSWKFGAAAPTAGFLSVWPIVSFGAGADDEVHYSLICPFRMAAGTAIQVTVDWCHQAVADNGTVCWGLEYRTIEPGEDVTGMTTTILGTSPGTHAQHDLVRTTLATGITGTVAHDVIGLRLYRDVSGDTLAVNADLIQVHFRLMMNKLGEPT